MATSGSRHRLGIRGHSSAPPVWQLTFEKNSCYGLIISHGFNDAMSTTHAFIIKAKNTTRKAIVRSGIDQRRLKKLWRPLWSRYVERTAPCVFVHIPKCAGTSVAHAVGMYGISHSTAADWRAHLGPDRFDARFRFAIVRHPVDRLISQVMWQSIVSRDFAVRYDTAADFDEAEDVNARIDAAVRTLLADSEDFRERFSMIRRIAVDGVNAMNFVGRFERLDEALAEVGRHVPVTVRDLPALKKIGDRTKKRVVLQPALVDELAEILREDFAAFDYEPTATKFEIAPRWT